MTRNRLLLTPQRIITDGLVAWHDLWFPNILLQSDTFSNATWTKYKCTAVQCAALTAPDGSLAWKLVEDSTAAIAHPLSQAAGQITGVSCVGTIKAKAGERTWVAVSIRPTNVWGVFFNLATGEIGTVSAGHTGTIEPLGDWWYQLTVRGLNNGGMTVVMAEADNDVTFDGTGTAPYTEDDPGIYIADAQLYPSATLPPYAATTTLQAIPDLSGNGNTLYRGSNTSAADTNDPTVLGPGLGFVTDDYAKTAALSGVTSAGDFTLILCGLFNWSGIGNCIASFGSAAGEMQWLQEMGAGELKIISTSTISNSSASRLAVSATVPSVLAITNHNDTLTCTRLDTGASITVADKNPTGAPVLTIGAESGGTAPATALTAYGDLLYNRVLSAAELQHNRRALKTLWAARGVTIL